MKIYIDNCCYNRPFDDQSQQRIYDETNAIASIINRTKISGDTILGSDILRMEIKKIRDAKKRFDIESNFYQTVNEIVPVDEKIIECAKKIMSTSNVKQMDALHISSAEFGNADIFLTTDDKLIKACQNLDLKTRVLNPVYYLAEVIGNVEY